MKQPPERCIQDVVDEETFVVFLQSLSNDWEEERRLEKENPSCPYGAGALGWENGSFGAFLDAAAAWAEAGGLRRKDQSTNPWRAAAEILLAGKYYE